MRHSEPQSLSCTRTAIHFNRVPMGAVAFGLFLLAGCAPNTPIDGTVDSQASATKDWSSHTQGLPFVIGYENGIQAAESQNKPTMLFVTTTWCGWCKKLASESFQDEEIKQRLTDRFVCVIVDGDTEKRTASNLGSKGFPHVVFQDANGIRIRELSGYVPKEEFRKILDEVLAKMTTGPTS